ncbi:MAG: hypothetical protein K6G16_11025 [Lachnospiraceae bacterium]|nr:hypothetical protein [Lachnospiraceae bacterium]
MKKKNPGWHIFTLAVVALLSLTSCGKTETMQNQGTEAAVDAEADEKATPAKDKQENDTKTENADKPAADEIPTMEEQLLLDISEASVTASNLEYTPGGNLTMDIIIHNKKHDETLSADAYASSMAMFTDPTKRYSPDSPGGDITVNVEMSDETIHGKGKNADLSVIDIAVQLFRTENGNEIELVNGQFPVYTSLYGPVSRPEPTFGEMILADTDDMKIVFTGETNVSTSNFLSAKFTVENKKAKTVGSENDAETLQDPNAIMIMGYIDRVNGYTVGDEMGEYDKAKDRRTISVAPGKTDEVVLNADLSSLIALGLDSIGSMDILMSTKNLAELESFSFTSNTPAKEIGAITGNETILHKDDSVSVKAYTQDENLVLLIENSTDDIYQVEFSEFMANGIALTMFQYGLTGIDTTNMGGAGFRLKASAHSNRVLVIPIRDALMEYKTSSAQTDGDIELAFTMRGSLDPNTLFDPWKTVFDENASIMIGALR